MAVSSNSESAFNKSLKVSSENDSVKIDQFPSNSIEQDTSASFKDAILQIDSLIRLGHLDEVNDKLEILESNELIQIDSAKLGVFYSKNGLYHMLNQQLDDALANYYQSVTYLKDIHPEFPIVLSNIGIILSNLKQHTKAKSYYLRAYHTFEAQENEGNAKLITMLNLGGALLDSDDDSLAHEFLKNALILSEKLNNKIIESAIYTNLSQYFLKKNNWEFAISHAKKSINIREDLKMPPSVITLNNMGYALAQSGEYETALHYYLKAIPLANLWEQKQLLLNIKKTHQDLGNLEEAIKYYEKYVQVKDSIAGMDFEAKISEISAKYESAQKEQKIVILEAENKAQRDKNKWQWYLIISAFIIFLMSVGITYMRFKNYKVKKTLNETLLKRQLLLNQLNPHFIFNALQSVQNYLYKNQVEVSMRYLGNFSRLIRLILENSEEEMITMEDEIHMIDHYLQLQQLNAIPKFQYKITYDEALEAEIIKIPSMMLQPFVENAVLHGVSKLKDGFIHIHFNKVKTGLEVSIKDNGKGIGQKINMGSRNLHKSMGTSIIQKRIEEYNKTHKRKIVMDLNANKHGSSSSGVHVRFVFPIDIESNDYRD